MVLINRLLLPLFELMNKINSPHNFLELLKELKDSRRDQGKMHSLEMIITIALMSIMSGYTSIRSMSIFAQTHKKDLCDLFKLKSKKRRIPSEKTIWRALTKIDFKNFSNIFYKWSKERLDIKQGNWLSLDGKCIGGTVTNSHNSFQDFISIVSVYSQRSKQILHLDQLSNKKENEILTVKNLIKMLDLKKVVFRMDALHCQVNTVKEIKRSENEYVIQVKGNQPKLHNQLKKTTNQSI